MGALMLLEWSCVVRMNFSMMISERTSKNLTSKTTQKAKLCAPEFVQVTQKVDPDMKIPVTVAMD